MKVKDGSGDGSLRKALLAFLVWGLSMSLRTHKKKPPKDRHALVIQALGGCGQAVPRGSLACLGNSRPV